MTITPGILSRTTAAAAVLAGLTFMAVQIGHPHLDVTSVDTTEWVIRNTAKMAFAALALAGITGMYLRQVKQMGVLGLIAYVLLSTGYLLIVSTAFVAGYVLPSLAETDPDYVNGVLAAAAGGMATSDIGLIEYALAAEGITYLAGGLLFGVALFRARILCPLGLCAACGRSGLHRLAVCVARGLLPAPGLPQRPRADRARVLVVARQ